MHTIDLNTLQDQHRPALVWIDKNASTSKFAASLQGKLAKFKSLTPNQLRAVESNLTPAAAAAVVSAAVSTKGVEKMKSAFDAAITSGIKRPRLRLDGFVVSPAKASGKNAGALYVKAGETYMGKIMDGKFQPTGGCNPELRAAVVAACNAPLEAVVAYGKKTGVCGCCGRELTDPTSVELGIGPICREKWGWA